MVSPSLILIMFFYYFILFVGDFDGSKIPCLCDVRVPANTCWEQICRRFLFVLTKNLVTEANDSGGKKNPLVTARANHQRAARLRSPRVKFQLKKTNLFKIPPLKSLPCPRWEQARSVPAVTASPSPGLLTPNPHVGAGSWR